MSSFPMLCLAGHGGPMCLDSADSKQLCDVAVPGCIYFAF